MLSDRFPGHLKTFQAICKFSRLSFQSLCRRSGNFPVYLNSFQALNLVPFQCSYDKKKHFTAITCFIAITYKVLYRKLIYAYLSRIVSNKTYALFHLENLSKKSPLPGKFLCFPPLHRSSRNKPISWIGDDPPSPQPFSDKAHITHPISNQNMELKAELIFSYSSSSTLYPCERVSKSYILKADILDVRTPQKIKIFRRKIVWQRENYQSQSLKANNSAICYK